MGCGWDRTLNEQQRIIKNAVLSQTFVNPAVTPTVVFVPFSDGQGIQIFISLQLKSGQVGTVVLQTGA